MKVDLGPSADLSIDKETSTGTVTAGGLLTYTLSVRNQDPATATNVQVRGFLPAGTRLVSISAENSDFGYEMCLGDASCNLGTVYGTTVAVSYTHLRAHETPEHLVCRLLLEKKKQKKTKQNKMQLA